MRRFYFGQPSGGFFFRKDFFTASCQSESSLKTAAFGPGFAFGLAGSLFFAIM
jgi:hypothetical protein